MSVSKQQRAVLQHAERQGNAWSGVVALVLLGMFALALVSSELDATDQQRDHNPTRTIIAGQ
ncbi:MAG: hypothetical protein AAF004_03585 [Pseudomonadota bacterium]